MSFPGTILAAVVALLCHPTSAFIAAPGAISRVYPSLARTATTTTRMSAAYAPKNVQGAWDNHFSAFGGKDIEKVLLDYDESSVITTYDQTADEKQVYEGVEGARTLFTGLFGALSDLSDLAAPVVDVSEDSKMVFLIWRCPASGFVDATDTFVFGDNMKIYRQNVAFRTG